VAAVAGLVVAVAGLVVVRSQPADPFAVTTSWVAARNAGDVDAAMGLLADTAVIFDLPMADPDARSQLRLLLEAQAIAGHRIDDRDCREDRGRVTCRYRQSDALLDRCGLVLAGVHTYQVRDGKLSRAGRTHDGPSRSAAYDAARAFRRWVEANHPDDADVIWADASDVTFSTPDGARAMVSIISQYAC
jgi:hypothetical protein